MQDINLSGHPFDLDLGWFRRHGTSGAMTHVEHLGGGGGFWNLLRIYPESRLGVVVLGNTIRHYDVAAIADAVARAAQRSPSPIQANPLPR